MKNPIVIFEDKTHSYWYGTGELGSDTRIQMNSVTTLWGQLGAGFDKELNIAAVAISELVGHDAFWRTFWQNKRHINNEEDLLHFFHYAIDKTYPIRKAAIRQEWILGADKGTGLHEKLENKIYKKRKYKNPFTGEKLPVVKFPKTYDNQSLVQDLYSLKDGVYPELLIWNKKTMIAGQADLVMLYTKDGIRYADVLDHKTNGGYSTKQGLKKREAIITPKGNKTMKYPIQHLIDCTNTHYRGQLSTYAHMLECFGYKVGTLALAHYLNFDPKTRHIIYFDYLQHEMPEIFEHIASQL